MLRAARHPIVDIGAEMQHASVYAIFDLELDREERRIVDSDAALLDRRNQEVTVAFALEDRCEQFYQCRPADRGFEIKPRPVGGDAHIEIATKWRIPALDWRRPFGAAAR